VLPSGRPASDTASEAGRREKLVVRRKNGEIILRFFKLSLLTCSFFISSSLFSREIGLVLSSSLFCRQEPNTSAVIQQSIPFGLPILLMESTTNKETVSGKSGYWYKTKYSGQQCWVFGGFLQRTFLDEGSNFELIKENLITCNSGGGIGFGFLFEPIIIGDMYIAPSLTTYKDDFTPVKSITIGSIKRSSQRIGFYKKYIGLFDQNGQWVKRINYDSVEDKILYFEEDENGPYYKDNIESQSRNFAMNYCSSKRNKDWFYEGYYTPSMITIEYAQTLFPIIRKKEYPSWNYE
jgi:hypothetical protein